MTNAAWLRTRIEASPDLLVVHTQLLPLAETMAQQCRRELAQAETHAVANIYNRMLRDFEDIIQQYAVAA
nr:hypothetical protein [uncultured Pseudomonas sp.]